MIYLQTDISYQRYSSLQRTVDRMKNDFLFLWKEPILKNLV